MSNQFRKRLLHTQPQHQTLFLESESTLQNYSEAYLKSVSRTKLAEDQPFYMQSRCVNRSAPASPSKSCNRLNAHGSIRRKYKQRYNHEPTPQAPQLHSPYIGLKVRRAVQADFDFHSKFTRDEVLNYFSVPAAAAIKKRGVKYEEDFKMARPQQKPSKIQLKEQQRAPTKQSQKLSSQLSGWGVQSDGMLRSSELDDHSYQIISNYPSINAGFTQDNADTLSNDNPSSSTSAPGECDATEMELPQYSLKIVPPSEGVSSANELISIKVVKEELVSCSLVEDNQKEKEQVEVFKQMLPSRGNAASIAKVHSKMSLDPKSEFKVGSFKHSVTRSKKTHESLPGNKENNEKQQEESRKQIEKVGSTKQTKIPSKGLLRAMLDSGKVSVSYSEDYVCSQNLDENDGIRVTECEETKAFRFDRNKRVTPPPAVPSPPVTLHGLQAFVKKERKSVVIEKIQRFGSDCKNFFSSLAEKINPFKERSVEEDSDLSGSILALRTLNSRIDLDSHCSPRDMKVCIREPTLMETQPWGMDSLQDRVDSLQERIGTTHEVRISAKDFSSEVRIALTNHGYQRQEFYSQEYLKAHTEQTVRHALGVQHVSLKNMIAQEAERAIQVHTDILLESIWENGKNQKEIAIKSIRQEVTDELAKLQEQIMSHFYSQ